MWDKFTQRKEYNNMIRRKMFGFLRGGGNS